MEYSSLITAIEHGLDELTSSDYPTLLGQLERLKALVWSKMVQADGHAETGKALLTMTQAARELNIPKSKAYELARQHRLPSVRIGKYVRVHPDQLAEYKAKLPRP